jgi:hypothetical protein
MADSSAEISPPVSGWSNVTSWFGGKSHFAFIAGYVGITLAFYLFNDSPNFPVFAGSLLSLCGFQTYRSVKADEAPKADPV